MNWGWIAEGKKERKGMMKASCRPLGTARYYDDRGTSRRESDAGAPPGVHSPPCTLQFLRFPLSSLGLREAMERVVGTEGKVTWLGPRVGYWGSPLFFGIAGLAAVMRCTESLTEPAATV
ncbi:hypothetical protein MRX96_026902 [Rhipicephalus microplus]